MCLHIQNCMISVKCIQGGSVTLACDLKEPGRPPASSFIWSETVCQCSNDVCQYGVTYKYCFLGCCLSIQQQCLSVWRYIQVLFLKMLFVNMAMQNRCLQNVEMLFVFSSNWAADLSFEYAFCQVGDTACQRAFLFKHWSETDQSILLNSTETNSTFFFTKDMWTKKQMMEKDDTKDYIPRILNNSSRHFFDILKANQISRRNKLLVPLRVNQSHLMMTLITQ